MERKKTNLPNFLVIGAARSGTTSLYNYLQQHPEIYMSPIKEPQFFAYEKNWKKWSGPIDKDQLKTFINNFGDYKNLFDGVKNEKAIGEASTKYLYSTTAPKRIKKTIPNIKLIAILRNPVDRGFSNFLRMKIISRESLDDYYEAVQEEVKRIKNNYGWMWHNAKRGLYYEQLKNYYDIFDKKNIRIYLFEEFIKSPQKILKDIFIFLGVDETFKPSPNYIYAKSIRFPRSKKLNFLLANPKINFFFNGYYKEKNTFISRLKTSIGKKLYKKPTLSEKTRKKLIEYYQKDIYKLEKLIGKDLSMWLK
jgi:hypothetical protein